MNARSCVLTLLFLQNIYAGKPVWVTIFTHGGGTHPMYFTVSDAFKTINDRIIGSVYEKTTQLLRTDPYFSLVQGIDHFGLHKEYPVKQFDPYNGAQIFAKFYAKMNDMAGFEPTVMYAFGWSSLLSARARRAAARDFYKAIKALVEHMRAHGFEPRLRIVAYSHGGNVSLYLAEAAQNYKYPAFKIEELIMISTPVQANTNKYLRSDLFKKIYLFYSVGDNIQSSDFLSSADHTFAHHLFIERHDFERPKKVTQIQIALVRKKVMYVKKDGTASTIHRRDVLHPNHTEMFFFGWTPEWYRRHFPLKPLPIAIFIPWMIQALEHCGIHNGDVRITIVPEDERMELRIPKTGQVICAPFLSQRVLTALRKQMWNLKPVNISEYYDRMRAHWKTAKEFVRNKFKQKRARSLARTR